MPPFHLRKGYFPKLPPKEKQMCPEIKHFKPGGEFSESGVETGELAWGWTRPRVHPDTEEGPRRGSRAGVCITGWWVGEDKTAASSGRTPSWDTRMVCRQMWLLPGSVSSLSK